MTDAIKFENVSKVYRLGSAQGSLRGAVSGLVQHIVRRRRVSNDETRTLWAMHDVSFSARRGEVLGLIGPNGAGKTTALKLISGVTKPTAGRVCVQGRLSALIELGAGFHPDLTGRENIYLNGVILGMSRREVERRFDAIVAFSELERFLDTPVKRYSSGMYCRLGFAVAAHLDPDVLLVDEVLSVGDRAFQSKCYWRIADLKAAGTTIVFVTHNLAALRRLCDRAILLYRGQIMADGDLAEVVTAYLDDPRYTSNLIDQPMDRAIKLDSQMSVSERPIAITGVTFLNRRQEPAASCRTGEPITVRVAYEASQMVSDVSVTIEFFGLDGTRYSKYNSGWDGVMPTAAIEGYGFVDMTLEPLCLVPGLYLVSVMVGDRSGLRFYDWHSRAYRLRVLSSPTQSDGLVYMPHKWRWVSDGQDLPLSNVLPKLEKNGAT